MNYMMLGMFALLIKNHDFNKKTSQVHPPVKIFHNISNFIQNSSYNYQNSSYNLFIII